MVQKMPISHGDKNIKIVSHGEYFFISGNLPPHILFYTDAPNNVFNEIISIFAIAGYKVAENIAKNMGYFFSTRKFSSKEEAIFFLEMNGYKDVVIH